MVIINAYLGAGSGSSVPTGKCLLNIVWVPSDGANKSGATVKAVIGSTTVQGTTDANGTVSLLVGTGSCTVTVTPTAGTYTGKTATVTAESGTEKTVVVNGYAPRTIVLYSPYTIKSTAWSLKQGSTTVASGTTFSSGNKNYSLNDATYVFSITAFGITRTKTFTTSQANTFIDLTDMFCKVTISGASSLTITSTFAGTSMGTGRTQYVVRGSTAIAYTGTVSQQINSTAIATVSNTTFTPTNTTLTLTLTVTGRVFLFTSTQDVTIPVQANYKVAVIGGGGGGQSYNSGNASYSGQVGGSSGQYVVSTINIPAGTYTVTIGAGGSIGNDGGATSFGTLLSGIGGYDATAEPSHEGMAGGGNTYSNKGGKGMGGATGGASGTALDNSDHFYTSTGSSYAGGTQRKKSSAGAGGLGAKGGNEGTSIADPTPSSYTYHYWGGAGGGGGVAGGNGGNGSNVSGRDSQSQWKIAGANGLGYGSGGAGLGKQYTGSSTMYWLGGGGGGGGLYNVANSTDRKGNPGACQIMWVS